MTDWNDAATLSLELLRIGKLASPTGRATLVCQGSKFTNRFSIVIYPDGGCDGDVWVYGATLPEALEKSEAAARDWAMSQPRIMTAADIGLEAA